MQWPYFPGPAPVGITTCWHFIRSPKNPASAAARGDTDWTVIWIDPCSLSLPPLIFTHTGCVGVCVRVRAHTRCAAEFVYNLWADPSWPHIRQTHSLFPHPPQPSLLVYPLHPLLFFFYSGSFCEINSSLPIFGLSAQGMESFFKGRRSRGRETDWVVAFFWVGKEQD